MKNSIKVTFMALVIINVIVWGLVAYANLKPDYDYNSKCVCTYWDETECCFTDKTGEDFWWDFDTEKRGSGTIDDCDIVNYGSYYCLQMDEAADPTTNKDDKIVNYYSISLLEYLQ